MPGDHDSDELFVEDATQDTSAGGADDTEDQLLMLSPQPPPSLNYQMDRVDGVLVTEADTVHEDENDVKVIEDAGREDMFVDAPEELVSFDGKISSTDTSEAIQISEPKGIDNLGWTFSKEAVNGRQEDFVMDELEHLQAVLGKTAGEKESLLREYEAERKPLKQELTNLRHQLSALTTQYSSINQNEGGYVNYIVSGAEEGEKMSVLSDAPLQEMIYDCSKFAERALHEHTQTQGTIRELHSILYKKDQEIRDLNVRVAESLVPQDIEATARRVLDSLAPTFYQGKLLDESITQKMGHIESSTVHLMEKYNCFLSGTELLRQCVTNGSSDHIVQDQVEAIFLTARDELLELKAKEMYLTQKVKELEDENWKQAEQLNNEREMVDSANAEIGKLKVELDHEKARYANTKEKLSLAVTKGKALVQQRDSLKQSLADKTSELEKYSAELQEKLTALEASELAKEELVKGEKLAASLQEVLSEKNTVIKECEEILSECGMPEELQSMGFIERVRWLANESNKLMELSFEFQKITNVLSSVDFPESMLTLTLESRVRWFVESFFQAKEDVATFQDLMSRTKEAYNIEIDELNASILAETQEKKYLLEEFNDLKCKYDEIVEKEQQISLEKDQIIKMLHEASGIAIDGPEELHSDIGIIVDRCFGKLKEKSEVSIASSHLEEEIFEKLQCFLYTRVQEAMLFERLLEEDMLKRSEVSHLANKMLAASQENCDLKGERDNLKNDLSRSEEKAALLREKLSMAVKKGKGLVQERESIKQLLDKTREAAHDEIDRLVASILAEIQEKNYIQEEFEDLRSKYEGLVEREHQISSEKDWIVRMLLEKSGISAEGLQELHTNMETIIDQCFEIFKEQGRVSIESPRMEEDLFQRIQSLLYTRDQDATLYEIMFEEDMQDRPEMSLLRNKIVMVSQELQDLKDAKDSLQNDLSHSEDKAALLKEKLSLAVKKGKGLVQERENMKQLLDRTREAAHSEIDRLTASILAETQEKNYLQVECEDLRFKYEGMVEKVQQIILEKDGIVAMLYEASGIAMEGPKELDSDMNSVIDRCFGKFKEQNRVSMESSHEEEEILERVKSLVYVRDQEAILFEKILDEDMLDRSEVNRLATELVMVSQELHVLKNEKDSLQNDLSRSEEKAALLREKLSMAIKKGKGLFQERENMKQILDEKNALIHKLNLDLEQQELSLKDFRDEINKLSSDVEHIPKLDLDLVALKEQRDQLERFLDESNRMLQRLIESIDSIVLLDDAAIEEPVEKMKWLAGYFSECQTAKAQAQQELEIVKDEVSTLSNNLAEAQATTKLLVDELTVVKNNISQLAEEKREVEIAKVSVEQELHKAMEKVASETLKFSQVCAISKSLENEIALAENKIYVLSNEKEDAQLCKAAAEMELQKVKEETSSLTSKLADAHEIIASLEDAISQAQTNVSLLSEENKMAQVGRSQLENEIEDLKKEADLQAGKLAEASTSIKSLEEAIQKAEDTISFLHGEKEVAAQEIVDLNSRLNACLHELVVKGAAEEEISDLKAQLSVCMKELAGTNNSKEKRFPELYGYLSSLQLLLNDETLLSLHRQNFVKRIEGLKGLDHLLTDIMHHLVEMDPAMLQKYLVSEGNVFALNSVGFDSVWNTEMVNEELNAVDVDNFIPFLGKIVDTLQLKNKFLAAVSVSASSSLDDIIAYLSTRLLATRDEVTVMGEHIKSLKQNMTNMETDKQAQEHALKMLEDNIATLLSACSDASLELEVEVCDPGLGRLSFPDVRPVDDDVIAKYQVKLEDISKYSKISDKLLSCARIVQKLVRQLQYNKNTMATTVETLQKSLKESNSAIEKAIEGRDFHQSRVFKLESDLEASESLCSELRLKLGEHQMKEDNWKEREAEFSSLYTTSMKEKETEKTLLSASQLKSLFKKIDRIEIPVTEFDVGELEPNDRDYVRKLFFIIDRVDGLQHQISLLSHDNELQQVTLKNQDLEIEHLKEELAKHNKDKQNSEKMKHELFDLAIGLEKIVQKLGGDEKIASQKPADIVGLLTILEKLVTASVLKSEDSKLKAQELETKMLRTQKVVDELTSKVKLLEDSNQVKDASADSIQERTVFEAHALHSQSEISEIEDVGPLVNIPIPAAPSTAHVRTLRKGSSDHLAINIDSESDRLISKMGNDEDKGHAFKSLNMSGLVPRQGRTFADRLDGLWVSGDRALMSRPRARLGVIAYWLFLNLWLLSTIL